MINKWEEIAYLFVHVVYKSKHFFFFNLSLLYIIGDHLGIAPGCFSSLDLNSCEAEL